MQTGRTLKCSVIASMLIVGLGSSQRLLADSDFHGVIKERGSDGTLIVQTDDSAVLVTLADKTKVRRMDGGRQMRASSAALVPGLRVKVEGDFQAENRFAAKRIFFSRADLKTARAIEAGLHVTDQRSLENQRRIDQNAQLLKQQHDTLQRQAGEIAANKGQITANAQQITANGRQINANAQQITATAGSLDATNSRISNLDNYNMIRSLTVYFANGKASIPGKFKTQLQEFAGQAKEVNGYLVEVRGYASEVGPQPINDELSMQRADAVTAVLQQSGIPTTSIVVPAAMGTTGQVASNKTKKGQAENRRTIVTLLQNKGIAGQ